MNYITYLYVFNYYLQCISQGPGNELILKVFTVYLNIYLVVLYTA